MLDTYDYEQLKGLGGHEVVASDGEKVGYVDLVFRDEETQQPEWLGIWDGLPDSKPRVLLPVRGVEVVDSAIRVPGRRRPSAAPRPTRIPMTSCSPMTASSTSPRRRSARRTSTTASSL